MGVVSDALTDTIKLGWYAYSYNTDNAPSTDAGVILTLPIGDVLALRIAVTSTSELYTSVYRPGETWGEWSAK